MSIVQPKRQNNPRSKNRGIEESTQKRVSKRSAVWLEFAYNDSTKQATCTHCQTSLKADSKKHGTNHLRRHLKSCKKRPFEDAIAEFKTSITTCRVTTVCTDGLISELRGVPARSATSPFLSVDDLLESMIDTLLYGLVTSQEREVRVLATTLEEELLLLQEKIKEKMMTLYLIKEEMGTKLVTLSTHKTIMMEAFHKILQWTEAFRVTGEAFQEASDDMFHESVRLANCRISVTNLQCCLNLMEGRSSPIFCGPGRSPNPIYSGSERCPSPIFSDHEYDISLNIRVSNGGGDCNEVCIPPLWSL